MIDSHVHLDAKIYSEAGGVAAILDSARNHGVDRMVTPALHLDSYRQLRTLSHVHDNIFPAIGIHPHEVSPERLENLTEALENGLGESPVPILGETGLEGHYDFAPLDLQLEFLRRHLQVSRVHGVPCIFHCRSSEQLLYDELSQHRTSKIGVVHCFTGTWEWAQRFLELGCYIGITGIVTFKNAQQVAEVASKVPLNRLLVETDGPYLAPIPHRGKTNKPEFIPLIVKAIANLRGLTSEEVAEATIHNTEVIFGLPEHNAPSPV